MFLLVTSLTPLQISTQMDGVLLMPKGKCLLLLWYHTIFLKIKVPKHQNVAIPNNVTPLLISIHKAFFSYYYLVYAYFFCI
jgi:hypothetical protein